MENKIAVCTPPSKFGAAAIAAAISSMTLPEVYTFHPDGNGRGASDVLSGRLYGRAKSKPLVKCLLPGCENMTAHNGGYCCAAHCREHNKLRGRK